MSIVCMNMTDIVEGENGRECTNCGKLKLFDEFYNNKHQSYGKTPRCKICIRKKQNKKTRTERNIPIFRDKLNQSKFCNKCGEYKLFDRFYSHKEGKYGLRPECKSCLLGKQKQWRKENKEEINKKQRERYYNNHEKHLKLKAERRKTKEWKEYNRQYQKEYLKDPENIKRINKRSLEKYHNDTLHRIKVNYRNALIRLLKNGSSKKASEYLGCSFKLFKKHLEDQFQTDMTWDNQGRGGWHIDHEIPCSKFDLTDPKQQSVCFHYSNLQPLWESDNCSKRDSIRAFSDLTINKEFLYNHKYIN